LRAPGFSNGATFSYLLYTQMPQAFAAFAGEAGPATFLAQATTPRPLLTINGEADAYVYPALADTMLAEFQRANHCGPSTFAWPFNAAFTVYAPADDGQPLVWRRHAGGHTWLSGSSEAMVAFFQEH
jgi:poly(3-hydroxybutyrate) depolymerase